ncbi:TonB-dependent receptor plug domain-containing protein [Sphingobacterium composti Ten et al. 2007 non Yoo et al. 2007]|uniref:TonB-dependent receptor plug domain-containing protein n=1 Tax=Sphingobacterium composti TaxID=363260 RepID=UPI001359B36D|nr:TonB-dependent receptor plug domain-containing protein [Sphingobacterium composti Ten et al. 2007 non Yoo et al. 2007]
MKQKLIAAILLFIFSSAQGQEIQGFLENVQNFNLNNPQEKVYLHTDKPAYSAGDNIYFKSYSTIGVHNLFSNLSGVLYVDLISPANDIVQKITISTPMGVGIGDFALNDTITEGLYRIRAYTNWMKNAGGDYFFEKHIPIYNGRTDNVVTQTTFEKREKDILYKINISSVTGLPIAKKRVWYSILEGEKIVERKSQSSTESGDIEIPVNFKYKNPVLKLRFENIDKSVVNKIVQTINPEISPVTTLFPEGGKLVAGRINTLAAKSINSQGLGVPSKVVIKQGNDTLGVINTNKLGMGATSLFLNTSAPLQATAVYEEGTQSVVEVPEVHQNGFTIVVNNLNESKLFTQLNISSDLQSDSEIFFIVHHLGEVFYVSKAKLNKSELVFSVEREKLPMGVITISILNNQFKPIIERPIFNHRSNGYLSNNVNLNKTSYKTREKVSVDIEVGGASDSTRMGAFSASVIDLSKVKLGEFKGAHLISSLLLSNDLKGYIEDPNYYFEDNSLKGQELDYLMLTQGWRNINWDSLQVDLRHFYSPEKTLKISGYTKKIGRTKPEPNAKLQLISTQNYFDFIDTTSNEEGYFEFDKLMFPDSVKFIITAKDGTKGKNNIDITHIAGEDFPINVSQSSAVASWDINRKYLDNLKSSKEYFAELERMGLKEKAILIDEVVVTRNKSKASEHSNNLNGAGNADQILSAEDLSTCTTLEMCLAGRLTGVYFQNGVPINTRGNVPMQVILDGMYIEADNLSMINVTDVESIEVLRNINYTAIYGSNGANGVIVITSKRGSSALNNYVPKGIITIQPQGFHIIKNFYKPVYDVDEAMKYQSDVRSTIHWEPSIVSNNEGKASFDFFTSDSKGKYLMIIEGIDLQGRLLRKEIELVVE